MVNGTVVAIPTLNSCLFLKFLIRLLKNEWTQVYCRFVFLMQCYPRQHSIGLSKKSTQKNIQIYFSLIAANSPFEIIICVLHLNDDEELIEDFKGNEKYLFVFFFLSIWK